MEATMTGLRTETSTTGGRTHTVMECGEVRLELAAPAIFADVFEMELEGETRNLPRERFMELVEALGDGYRIDHYESWSAVRWGKTFRNCITLHVEPELARELDPERQDWPAHRATIAAAMNVAAPRRVQRATEVDGDVVQEPAIIEGFNPAGRIVVSAEGAPAREYTTIDAILTDGWVPAGENPDGAP